MHFTKVSNWHDHVVSLEISFPVESDHNTRRHFVCFLAALLLYILKALLRVQNHKSQILDHLHSLNSCLFLTTFWGSCLIYLLIAGFMTDEIIQSKLPVKQCLVFSSLHNKTRSFNNLIHEILSLGWIFQNKQLNPFKHHPNARYCMFKYIMHIFW